MQPGFTTCFSITRNSVACCRDQPKRSPSNSAVFSLANKTLLLLGALCVSLEVFTPELGEVRSLAVDPDFARLGHGRVLVEQLEVEARRLGLQRLMALTYVPDFFDKLGFKTTAMDTLPEKVFGVCVTCPKFNHCDEIAMVKSLDSDSPVRSTADSV